MRGPGISRRTKGARRWAALGAATLLALALTDLAPAAYAPELTVSGATTVLGGRGAVTIAIAQAQTDDPTARIVIYAPPTFQATLNQPAGTTIGSARASVNVRELAGANVEATGPVVTDDPARYAEVAARCTQRQAVPQAVWLLRVSVAGQPPLDVPAFVERSAGAEAAFSSFKLQICFRSPDIPASEGGQPLGVKPLSATMTITGVFTNPESSGEYRWTALFVPYAAGSGTPNPRAAVESQAIVRLPARLTLSARRMVQRRRSFARLSGVASESDQGLLRATVAVFAGRSPRSFRRVRSLGTGGSGQFAATIRLTRPTFFQARITVRARSLTPAACLPAISLAPGTLPPATCSSVSIAGFTAQSRTVKLSPPPRKARKRRR